MLCMWRVTPFFYLGEFETGASGKLGQGFGDNKKGFEGVVSLDGER